MSVEQKRGPIRSARMLPNAVPPDDGDDGLWDDYTPITNQADAPQQTYEKIAQTTAMVKHLVHNALPALQAGVGTAKDAAQQAQREAFEAANQVKIVRQRVEDVCHRVECLEPVKVEGAVTQERVEELEERVKAAGAKRHWLWGVIISIALALLGSAATAIWWASQVDASVRHESLWRSDADQTLTREIEKRPTRDEVLTRDELRALRTDLSKSREATVEEWLQSLPPEKRRAVQKIIGKGAPGH